jgi:Domain of unknown function (DUF4406)
MHKVYICHPFRDDQRGNITIVKDLCRMLFNEGSFPIAPHIYLPQFVSEKYERQQAMEMCLELVELCDEVRVFGHSITDGMRMEIDHASTLGMLVVYANEQMA